MKNHTLPASKDLELNLQYSGGAEDLISENLLTPLSDLLSRPSKAFRGQLVQIGFSIVGGTSTEQNLHCCNTLASVVECLHAASLSVDDIQDSSPLRRGRPSLHVLYGIPRALNAGNWLYFWPFELIKKLPISPETKLTLYETVHDSLLRAHYGQALDVGVPIHSLPQSRIPSVCLSSVELKSGVLMALPLELGARLAGANSQELQTLRTVGQGLGLGLQMYNDIGNAAGRVEPEKRYEDLMLRRPSWLWAFIAETSTPEEFSGFIRAVDELPNDGALQNWLSKSNTLKRAKDRANLHMEQILGRLQSGFVKSKEAQPLVSEFQKLIQKIAESYE